MVGLFGRSITVTRSSGVFSLAVVIATVVVGSDWLAIVGVVSSLVIIVSLSVERGNGTHKGTYKHRGCQSLIMLRCA